MANDKPILLEDDDEFIRLFGRSQCALHAFIMSLVARRADADDLLQEVNMALWRKRSLYDARREFLSWAMGFARIEVSNYRKKHSKNRMLFNEAVVSSLADDWPTDLTHHERRLEALQSCMKRLEKREQHYVTEFYKRDVSVSELSKLNGTPASTVYKILGRARESLRRCVRSKLAQSHHPT